MIDDRPFLPLCTVLRMLRAAYQGLPQCSPVRDFSAYRYGSGPRDQQRECRCLREIGAQQLLAHGVSLERAGRLIRKVRCHRGEPLLPTSVAGLASMGRVHLWGLAERRERLRVKPAAWRAGRSAA